MMGVFEHTRSIGRDHQGAIIWRFVIRDRTSNIEPYNRIPQIQKLRSSIILDGEELSP